MHTETEIAQASFDQHRDGHRQGDLHQNRGQCVRQDVPDDDTPVARPNRPAGSDEILFLHCHDAGAHQTGKTGHKDHADGENDALLRSAKRRYHQNREKHRGKGEDGVLQSHEDAIDPASPKSGDESERNADEHRQSDANATDDKLDTGAIDDATEDVAAIFVGAEQVLA